MQILMNINADHTYMDAAMEEARRAAARGEVPIGAVLVDRASGEIVARAGNRTREMNDPTAHAEILVIRACCAKVEAQRIPGHDLYVTLEPCAMCAGAIAFARIDQLVFAASDPKGGGVIHGGRFFDQPTCHHRIVVQQLEDFEKESADMLREFFAVRR